MEPGVQEKLKHLKDLLAGYDGLAVAFSGGVDSTFLLMCAKEVLGPRVLALTINGPQIAPAEIAEARQFCESHDISQLIINMPEEIFDSIADNPPERCYICKRGMFTHMLECIDGMPLADGSNADDGKAHRPGRRALKELGIVSPLEEAGFTKAEIRTALKAMNLPVWNKPANPCLATRFPYGERLTHEKMQAVDEIEQFIRALGFAVVRVRAHGQIAIVEVPPEDREQLARPACMDRIRERIHEKGFLYAAMDMDGYKSGSMDRVLPDDTDEKINL